jgi:uncharacterized protein (DUF2236 family)
VKGTAPDGRPYAADDPHLLAWVHVALIDSLLAAYRRYGSTRMTRAETNRYISEFSRIPLALGSEPVPTALAELQDWFVVHRPELHAGRQAKETVRFLLAPSVPLVMRPPFAVVAAAAVGLLPGWARGMLGLPRVPLVETVAVRPATTAMVRMLGWALGPPQIPALTAA